jgi:hypothetical protein
MKIAFNPEQLTSAGVTYERHDNNAVRLLLPGDKGGFYVSIEGDDMVLTPERSASHRQLLGLLGQPQPEPPGNA